MMIIIKSVMIDSKNQRNVWLAVTETLMLCEQPQRWSFTFKILFHMMTCALIASFDLHSHCDENRKKNKNNANYVSNIKQQITTKKTQTQMFIIIKKNKQYNLQLLFYNLIKNIFRSVHLEFVMIKNFCNNQ